MCIPQIGCKEANPNSKLFPFPLFHSPRVVRTRQCTQAPTLNPADPPAHQEPWKPCCTSTQRPPRALRLDESPAAGPPANPHFPLLKSSKESIGFHAFSSPSSSQNSHFLPNLHLAMADQCIVCLENLDSAIPLQQLQGDEGGGGGVGSGGLLLHSSSAALAPAPADLKPTVLLPLAAASPTASSTTTNDTIASAATTTKDLASTDESGLDNDDNIAVIQVCGHILHDSCLKAWTGKANSCPICRQAFHLVEVYDKIGGAFRTSFAP